MRILSIDQKAFHEFPYLGAAKDRTVERRTLPFLAATVDRLPEGIDGLVVASDLQGYGRRRHGEASHQLLGVVLPEEFEILAKAGRIPPLDRIGVLLAGDLYAKPAMERRGGRGDVREVWRSFARLFRWTCGIAGNHDLFGESPADLKAFLREPRIHLLDGELVVLDGLRIAGVSGVIGNPRKAFHKDESEFIGQIELALCEDPNLLILHQGPDTIDPPRRGSPEVRRALTGSRDVLVVCGHCPWEDVIAELPDGGPRVLNVCERVVFLQRGKQP